MSRPGIWPASYLRTSLPFNAILDAFAVTIRKSAIMHLLSSPAFISLLAMPSFGQMTKITIIYISAVAFVLGVLVFVHEFGHYAVAKLCGVEWRSSASVLASGFGASAGVRLTIA